MIYLHSADKIALALAMCLVITSFLFLYMAYSHLKSQPFYSPTVNNYKFGIYFSLGVFALYTLLICILKINNSRVIAITSAILVILPFVVGYMMNRFYTKRVLVKIYKKFYEKKVANESKSDLIFNDENLNKKNIYKSVERISTTKLIIIKE